MDKFVKRLQTRASRKGIKVSKSQVREIYVQIVTVADNPTDDEMSAVIEQIETQYQAPSSQPSHDLATTEKATPIPQEKPQQMTQAQTSQTSQQPSNSAMTTSSRSSLANVPEGEAGITQQEIRQAVESQFGRENVETKTAILNYVANDTFSTAQELQLALSKLRQMRLDILLKLIDEHNQSSSEDENTLKAALSNATAKRQRETEDFFDLFENQLEQMRATFGV